MSAPSHQAWDAVSTDQILTHNPEEEADDRGGADVRTELGRRLLTGFCRAVELPYPGGASLLRVRGGEPDRHACQGPGPSPAARMCVGA